MCGSEIISVRMVTALQPMSWLLQSQWIAHTMVIPKSVLKPHSFIHSFIHSSMALQPLFIGPWPLLQFRDLFTQTVGLLGRVISSSQGRYLRTEQHKHRINAHTNIHASSRIRTYDPSVRASEDSLCLRPLGYRDRHWSHIHTELFSPIIKKLFPFLNVHTIHPSVALQPFVERWPLFQFLNLIHSRKDSLKPGFPRVAVP
jgi:hypothetical protein